METLIEKYKKIENHDPSNLCDETNYILKDIWAFALQKEYRYNQFPKPLKTDIYTGVFTLTLNERKKLKKAINMFRKKQSLASANRFYHFLYTKVLRSTDRIRLEYPQKYLDILEKRKIFVTKRKEMEDALVAYKAEKGDYFLRR